MASSASIFRAGEVDIAGVLVDTRLSEEHTSESEVTLYPVDGSDPDVTEHVILKPRTISVVAWVSNIDGPGAPAIGVRASKAHADLHKLNRERGLLEYVSYHEIYENLILNRVKTVHEDLSTGAIKVELTFTQIVQIAITILPSPAANISNANIESHGRSEVSSASSEVDGGRKTSQQTSTLYDIANGVVK